MPRVFPISYPDKAKVMIFVDGENLAIRFKSLINKKGIDKLEKHVIYEPDIFVWSQFLCLHTQSVCAILRIFYYTSLKGDENKLLDVFDKLKNIGVTDPKVFKKKQKNRTKRVDITLATDMLSHAYNNNYEIAVLVAGDEDYVPLIREIKHSGKQVSLWFFEDGLSSFLRRECDNFFNLDKVFFEKSTSLNRFSFN